MSFPDIRSQSSKMKTPRFLKARVLEMYQLQNGVLSSSSVCPVYSLFLACIRISNTYASCGGFGFSSEEYC
jgi:hypothetical protein